MYHAVLHTQHVDINMHITKMSLKFHFTEVRNDVTWG